MWSCSRRTLTSKFGPCWYCLLQVQLASIREMSINNWVYWDVQELYLRLVSAFAQCMVLSVALVRKTWRMKCSAQRTNCKHKSSPVDYVYTQSNLIRTFYCLIYYLGMSGTSRTGSQTVVQVSQGWFGLGLGLVWAHVEQAMIIRHHVRGDMAPINL